MGFLRFIGRGISGAVGSMIVSAILLALGVTPGALLATVQAIYGTVPWPYIMAAQLVCIALAITLIARVFYKQLEFERPLTPALRRMLAKRHFSFGEAAARLSEAHQEYTTDEIIHRLMKAFWRGEFEKNDGTGLVFHQGNSGVRSLGGGSWVHLKGPHDQRERDADPNPDKLPYGRRVLAFRDSATLSQFYPSVLTLQSQFNDTEYTWAALRRQVDWRIFEMIEPSQYSGDYRRIWVDQLMIPRHVFMRWYRRFRKFAYED